MSNIAQHTFEDLSVGMEAEMTHIVVEEAIKSFCKLTGDTHPLHTSIDYANAHGFKNIIAHGLLISSYSSSIIGLSLPGENAIIISQEFKYRNPLYPNSKISVKGKISEIDERFKSIKVNVKIRTTDSNTLIATGSYKVKLRK